MAHAKDQQGKTAYRIIPTKQFRKDLRRLHRSGHDLAKLHAVVTMLAEGKELPRQYRNHPLRGDLANREECHIATDWLLIYQRREDVLILQLLRTGTHADLFGD